MPRDQMVAYAVASNWEGTPSAGACLAEATSFVQSG